MSINLQGYKSPLSSSSFADIAQLPPQMDLSDIPANEDTIVSELHEEITDRYQLFINEGNAFSHICHMALALKGLQRIVRLNVVRHEFEMHGEDKMCPECNIMTTKITIKEFAVMMNKLFVNPYFAIPLLYDTHTHTVISTESDVIIEFLNNNFNEDEDTLNKELNLCPVDEKSQKRLIKIEKNRLAPINHAIGKATKASSKEEFEKAAAETHEALQGLEKVLTKRRYLCGSSITEADILEFVALFRFDPLLSHVFPLNKKRITLQESYPHIFGWLQDMYQQPGVADTCDLVEIANGKSFNHAFGIRINELEIEFDDDWESNYLNALSEAHGREEMGNKKKRAREEDKPKAKSSNNKKAK